MHRLYPDLTDPDLLLNIGNMSLSETKSIAQKAKGWLQSTCIPRLGRAFMTIISGDTIWNNFISQKKKHLRHRYRRLDVKFHGSEPGLDDVACMPLLKSVVETDKNLLQEIEEIAHRIVSCLFYFELTQIPDGNVEGKILCVRKAVDPALTAIYDRLRRNQATFIINNNTVEFREECNIDLSGNFEVVVKLPRTDKVSILLQEAQSEAFHISGSPFRTDDLIEKQGLRAFFGTGRHKRTRTASCLSQRPSKKRKIT